MQAELQRADMKLNRAKTRREARLTLAKEGRITNRELEEFEDAVETAQDELRAKQVEVQGTELQLKQARRRAEFEEVRLKRLAERAKDRLDWSSKMLKQGYVSSASFAADRDRYDELMFQLDPNYKPTPEPLPSEPGVPKDLQGQTELKKQLLAAEWELAEARKAVTAGTMDPDTISAVQSQIDELKRQLDLNSQRNRMSR